MKRLLNTLFVTTQGSYLAKERETVAVRCEGETLLRLPILNLDGIVCFGNVTLSPFLLGFCGERDVKVSLFTERGRFLARILGKTSGNVLLRKEQYRRADDLDRAAAIARHVVVAKIANSRSSLLRAVRSHPAGDEDDPRRRAVAMLGNLLRKVRNEETSLDEIRGHEGAAAQAYFSVFDRLVRADGFSFPERSRRPPADPLNALLSFFYALLRHDVESACEGVGLDPAVGFLHRDRPGRPGLALDLMEELRPVPADRLALTLVNRRQVSPADFEASESGGVWLGDEARKTVLVAYQERKQQEITHPFLGEKIPFGLVPHVQALLLARHLRGDLDAYPPFLWS